MNNTIDGVQVRVNGFVMLLRFNYEFGEALDGVRRVFGEKGIKCAGNRIERFRDIWLHS